MSIMDKLIVSLRDTINGVEQPVDQLESFYFVREFGANFIAPFSLTNVNYCGG